MELSVLKLAAVSASLALTAPTGALTASHAYDLSTVGGVVRSDSLRLAADPGSREVLAFGDGLVRIFNDSGMEVFRFGDDSALGNVTGAAVLDDGSLLVLSYVEGQPRVLRCNFRGEFRGELPIAGVPAGVEFRPGYIAHRAGQLYLADLAAMRVLVADAATGQGQLIDLAEKIESADKRADLGISGLTVDPRGNLVFTVAPLFKVFELSPAGEVRSFGRPGGAPGLFNVVSGVAVDEQGRFFVADALKNAVIAFDRDFRFLGEFGYGGNRPGSLAGPSSILALGGKVLVSQVARRGVAVFRVTD
jgi:hypothetical protein